MRSMFFKSKQSGKKPEHALPFMQLAPRVVLLYLLTFFDCTDAIHFEISLGSKRKSSNGESLLEQYAGKKADQLKFKALAHAAPVLLEKLNQKIEDLLL